MTIFDQTPLRALGLALLVAMVPADLGGAGLHAWLDRAKAAGAGQVMRRGDQGSVLSGVFWLLGLLMTFAFCLAIGRPYAAAALALFVLLCAAYITVLDLDRPRAGAIVVPQGELDTVAAALP